MIEISSLLLLGIGEILLVTMVISAVLIFVIINGKSKDKTSAKVLVSRIKEDADRRLSETQKVMEEQYGFADEELKEIVAKIVRDEKVFYQNVINMYLKRDQKAFENMNVDFEGAVETYRTLEVPDRSTGDDESAEAQASLQTEIESLKAELKITMNTMGNMLAEYAAAFSGEASASMTPSAENSPTDVVAAPEGPAENESADDDELMDLDAEESGDGKLMNLNTDKSDDSELMSLDAEESGDGELMDLDVDESGDGELMDLDIDESGDGELMDLDIDESGDDELMDLDIDESDDGELMDLDIDESADEELLDLGEDDFLDLDAPDGETSGLPSESLDADTQPSQEESDSVDDPDLLLDQIRAEDEGEPEKP